MRTVALLALCILMGIPVGAASLVENIGGRSCKGGMHKQPHGPFAVYVFCDDAMGTNIAVYYSDLGEPRFEKWTLTRRFWQSDDWGADVHSIGWVPDRNSLVVTTSEVYGTGAVYLLDLEKQTFVTLAEPKDCGSQIEQITDHSVTVRLNGCEHPARAKSVVLTFIAHNSAPPN
jgi:hypothetical protein